MSVDPQIPLDPSRLSREELEAEVGRWRARAAAAGPGRRQRAVLDSTVSFAIILTDREGLVTDWNVGAERILDWPAAEMVGRTVERIFTPEDVAADRAGTEMRLSLEHGRADDERWHLRRDGSRFWASGEMMPLRGDDGAHLGFVKVLRDRTAEHRAGRELEDTARRLRESEDHYRHTVELNPQVPWTCDPEGNITSYSNRWLELTGQAPGEPLGAGWARALHPDDVPHTMAAFGKSLAAGEPVDVDYRIYDAAAGEHRWMRARAYPRRDEGGTVVQWYGVVEDIHERKLQAAELALLNATLEEQVERRTRELMAAEDALRQSQKLEAVGQLTGGVAHDFNNLLTIIRSSVDFLRRPDLPEERRARYMDAVSDTVDRAAKLTGQLLAFARRQALKPEVFDVGERLRSVADMLDTVTGARIRVVAEVGRAPCHVRADLSQFETALVNLAVNARDAMDGEGRLTLRLDCCTAIPPIRGHAAGPGCFAAISLTDTGSGIPPELVERIFEPFFTTKEVGKGTGLGLSQVYGFVKQSGGNIDVRSVVDGGTTFTLYLPEVDAEARVDREAAEGGPIPGGAGQRVLVVEDNVDVGRFATQILRDLGYETQWATNAEEALDRLGADGSGFDAVFSDVVMPGMGGLELAENLRRRLPHLPVVLASGYSEVLAREGGQGFELLNKPYSADQLSRVLTRVSRGSGRRAARG